MDLNENELDALGNYYLTYENATSNEQKLYALLMAFRKSSQGSSTYHILGRALLKNGFDPKVKKDIDNFILGYLTDHYRHYIDSYIVGPDTLKIKFLKDFKKQSDDPFKQQAAQIILDERYSTEI